MLAKLLENGDDANQPTVTLSERYGGLKPRQEWRQVEGVESEPEVKEPGAIPTRHDFAPRKTTKNTKGVLS